MRRRHHRWGVNGTGVARDATLRGLKVTLFERNDFAFGASGNSSGMIHGGPRYLSADPKVTRISCLDSGHIQAIAPHLSFRVPFLMPIGPEGTERTRIELVDAFFEAYDFYQPLKHGKPHARLTPDELYQLEPGLLGAGRRQGEARRRNHVRRMGHRRQRGSAWPTRSTRSSAEPASTRTPRSRRSCASDHAWCGARRARAKSADRQELVRHHARGRERHRRVGALTAKAGGLGADAARVRPGKGIHVVFDRRLTNYAILAKTIDGRQIFIEPWQNVTVLGTTDDDFYGDLDDVRATSDEVRYLQQGIANVLPGSANARAIGTTAGVRPTLYEYGPNEDELSRDHRVVDHPKDGAPGLFLDARRQARELPDFRRRDDRRADDAISERRPSRAARTSLPCPGGEGLVRGAWPRSSGSTQSPRRASPTGTARGRNAIAERIRERPLEATVVCPCEPVSRPRCAT